MRDFLTATGCLVVSNPTQNNDGTLSVQLMQGLPKKKATSWAEQQPIYLTAIFTANWKDYLSNMANARTSKSLKGSWVDIQGIITFTAVNGQPQILIEPMQFNFSSCNRLDADDKTCSEELFKYHGGIFQLSVFTLRLFSERTRETLIANRNNTEPPAYLTFNAAHDQLKGAPKQPVSVCYHLLFGTKTVKQADRCLYNNSHIDFQATLSSVSVNIKDDISYVNVSLIVDKFQLSPSISSSEKSENVNNDSAKKETNLIDGLF